MKNINLNWVSFSWIRTHKFLIFCKILSLQVLQFIFQYFRNLTFIFYSKFKSNVIKYNGTFIILNFFIIVFDSGLFLFVAWLFFCWHFLDLVLHLFFILLLNFLVFSHNFFQFVFPFEISYFQFFIPLIFLHKLVKFLTVFKLKTLEIEQLS